MPIRRPGLGLMATLTVAMTPTTTSHAQELGAPVEVQIPLLFKALTFDRNRTVRNEATLVVAVVYQGRNRTSLLVRDEALGAIRRFAAAMSPRSVRTIQIDLDGGDLEALLDRHRPGVLYVTPLRATRIEDLAAAARRRRIATVTGVPQYVESGLAMGIGLRGDRPEIVINLAAAKAEGSDYGSQLLRLARVVGGGQP